MYNHICLLSDRKIHTDFDSLPLSERPTACDVTVKCTNGTFIGYHFGDKRIYIRHANQGVDFYILRQPLEEMTERDLQARFPG